MLLGTILSMAPSTEGKTFASQSLGSGDWTSCPDPWRCYMQHTGESGIGPPVSWCDPDKLGGTITDEDGSGGSATTGMCH
mmetsp:Transcript_68271/g.142261  ORF Transcript_68271/g.142261 Transcript_68271/m.142261 type:complete len:80 (-) Transcript_68271:138-377(-)